MVIIAKRLHFIGYFDFYSFVITTTLKKMKTQRKNIF